MKRVPTIEQIRQANHDAGFHFFDAGAMRFFRSRILPTVYAGEGGIYFVTSEQFECHYPENRRDPRRYTVRQFLPKMGNVETVGAFQQYAAAEEARKEAMRMARGAS